MKNNKKSIFIAFVFVASVFSTSLPAMPAMAEMPQTDVDFVNQMSGTDAEKLNALGIYYDLHVSELEVQLITEQNTGAFLGGRRAEREGDKSEAKRLLEMYENTKDEKTRMENINSAIRIKLGDVSKIEFPASFIMAPEAPHSLPPIAAKAVGAMKAKIDVAWQSVLLARKSMKMARMDLLDGQDKYNAGKKGIHIGDLMRSVTTAEISLARSAADLRLLVASISVAGGQPLADALSGM